MARMKKHTNKKILLGVSGGIACYKACEIVRLLVGQGLEVHVAMTDSATQFVTPMTFQALSKNTVHTNLFDLTQESEMGHISLADHSDLILVAPATANFIGKLAHGLCDDLLSTVICATKAPVVLAPAMNCHMYENPLVQKNIRILKDCGYQIINPGTGSLACGYEGEGRLEEPEEIVKRVMKLLKV